MPWVIPVVLRIIAAHVMTPVVMKKLTDMGSRTRRIRAQFLFCFLFAVVFAIIMGVRPVLDKRFLWVACIGAANSFAAYALWRAIAISLSRQALFTMMDDIIPVAMGYVLLGENAIMTLWLGSGILICIGGATVYAIVDSRQKAGKEVPGTKPSWHIFVWIGIYSVIWGVAHFLFRYFAITGIPSSTFLLGWYGGALLGSFGVVRMMGAKEAGPPLSRRGLLEISGLAVLVWISLILEYMASTYAHLAVTQPIFQVSEMVIPTLIGLWYFKEVKELSRTTKAIFAVAFVGSLIVALSYHPV